MAMLAASRRLSSAATAALLRREKHQALGPILVSASRSRVILSQGLLQNFGVGGERERAAKGNKLHNYGFEALPFSGACQTVAFGVNFPFRCMTTMADSTESTGQDNSASSSEIVQLPRVKFKRLDKTAKHIMNILDKEAVEKVQAEREFPDIQPGCIIQLKVEVPENKRRVQVLKGIVIARRNAGLNTTFRLRRQVAGVGMESVYPLYSPNIKEMKILDKKKVRRAKLYYLRDRLNALKNK